MNEKLFEEIKEREIKNLKEYLSSLLSCLDNDITECDLYFFNESINNSIETLLQLFCRYED